MNLVAVRHELPVAVIIAHIRGIEGAGDLHAHHARERPEEVGGGLVQAVRLEKRVGRPNLLRVLVPPFLASERHSLSLVVPPEVVGLLVGSRLRPEAQPRRNVRGWRCGWWDGHVRGCKGTGVLKQPLLLT